MSVIGWLHVSKMSSGVCNRVVACKVRDYQVFVIGWLCISKRSSGVCNRVVVYK